MNTSELVTIQHLTRIAIVYIRQSTPNQVLSNQESLELQYALKQRAIDLGWDIDNISIIDVDLGLTGASVYKREGFKEILTKVTLGEVGIILSYDVTRLSRNCSDWYQLLDLCGYKRCLIADREGVYDPGTINGRLLLGLKGQLAELELSTIKSRLTAGLLNKAQRGDLALSLPIGLIRDKKNDCVYKDPNLEIQTRISLIFELFLEKKTTAKVLRYFKKNNLTIPRYNSFGELYWRTPNASMILRILKNPAYAGAFAYGRTQIIHQDITIKKTKTVPRNEWKILVKDKYPAYIDWETFEKIQSIIADNYAEYTRLYTRGIPRTGTALLHGIMYCGECGHKLFVLYKQKNYYICNHLQQKCIVPNCQRLPADPIDEYVVSNFFEALNPIELDAYTKIVVSQTEDEKKINKVKMQQLERLKYQTKLAEHQFNQVDPYNRLVAAELEKRWEQSLHDLNLFELEYKEKQINKPIPQLSQELKEAFLNVGKKLPNIWNKSILSMDQKKAFIRCLVDKVIAHRIKPDILQVRIVWKGGETTTSTIPITVGAIAKLSLLAEMEQAIIKLGKAGRSDLEIAKYLTKHGYHSPTKDHVVKSTVKNIRLRYRILNENGQSRPCKVEGYLSVTQLARLIKVAPHVIYDYIYNGKIKVDKFNNNMNGKYLFLDTPETINVVKTIIDIN